MAPEVPGVQQITKVNKAGDVTLLSADRGQEVVLEGLELRGHLLHLRTELGHKARKARLGGLCTHFWNSLGAQRWMCSEPTDTLLST